MTVAARVGPGRGGDTMVRVRFGFVSWSGE